jgi:sensor histidine kinase YesM
MEYKRSQLSFLYPKKTMYIIQKEYHVIFTKISEKDEHKWEPYILPYWFAHSSPLYKKIVRILGATGGVHMETDEIAPLQPLSTLWCNVANDTPTNGFIMIMNNYNSVKEYDITNSHLTQLEFDVMNLGHSNVSEILKCIIEIEILLIDG